MNYLLPFQRIRTPYPWAERIQDYIERFVEIFRRNPLLDGQFIEEQIHENVSGYTRIEHGLGRIPRGAICTGGFPYPPPAFCRYESGREATNEICWVYSSDPGANLPFDLWVF